MWEGEAFPGYKDEGIWRRYCLVPGCFDEGGSDGVALATLIFSHRPLLRFSAALWNGSDGHDTQFFFSHYFCFDFSLFPNGGYG